MTKYPRGVYNAIAQVTVPYTHKYKDTGEQQIINYKYKDTGEQMENKDCCCKHTERSGEERKKLINRLNRIEGQIRGIRAMVERDAYCPDILVQSAAVNAAVNSFNKDLIASHIRTCVVRDIREGNDEVIGELVETLQKLMK